MEKKIKTLYILSIVAILAFLGMQVYWLYIRYEYSLTEYENILNNNISDAVADYNKVRAAHYPLTKEATKIQSSYNMNTDMDSAGIRKRTVTVRTRELNGRKLLGISEERNLTPEEMERLQNLVLDSLEMADAKIATVDASSAPSDAMAWDAMRNFEGELQSPFTKVGIDSIMKRHKLNVKTSLVVQDSLIWEPVMVRHSSVFAPSVRVVTPYSELERKAVVIECSIPTSAVLLEMGGTLAIAVVLSLFLITCLVWQIMTIAKLTRLDKMRNSFITTMIHELKRPISTLKMCVSGIDDERLMEDPQVRHELTSETRIALDNLSAYFSKLRDITFNNVEQIPLNVTCFNLSDLVEGVMKSTTIPSAKQVIFKNDTPNNMEISADRTHAANLITNLIENAIKYSGDNVTIAINAEQNADGVAITVADNGFGIPLSDQNKIFNRFYRGSASKTEIPGIGLGLAYVKLLVEAHGGNISVESSVGHGSIFTIKLPQ